MQCVCMYKGVPDTPTSSSFLPLKNLRYANSGVSKCSICCILATPDLSGVCMSDAIALAVASNLMKLCTVGCGQKTKI